MPSPDDGWPSDHVKRLCDLWQSRFGPGSAPGAIIAGSAKRLRKAGATWDRVMGSWKRYLQVTDAEWANPGTWASKWATWAPAEKPAAKPKPVAAETFDKHAVSTWWLIAHALETMLPKHSFDTFVAPMRPERYNGAFLVVRSPGPHHTEWFRDRETLVEAAVASCGLTCKVRIKGE